MDKSWKKSERRVAKRMGGRRIPVTGERAGVDVARDDDAVVVLRLKDWRGWRRRKNQSPRSTMPGAIWSYASQTKGRAGWDGKSSVQP